MPKERTFPGQGGEDILNRGYRGVTGSDQRGGCARDGGANGPRESWPHRLGALRSPISIVSDRPPFLVEMPVLLLAGGEGGAVGRIIVQTSCFSKNLPNPPFLSFQTRRLENGCLCFALVPRASPSLPALVEWASLPSSWAQPSPFPQFHGLPCRMPPRPSAWHLLLQEGHVAGRGWGGGAAVLA